MTTQGFNTADELRRVIAEGHISEFALEAITGIPREKLQTFLDETKPGTSGLTTTTQALSGDEGARLSILASQIIQGLEIDDDERLKAILEGLTIQFRLTLENIALLTRASLDDLEIALRDPGAVPAETKYALGLRLSYLNLAIANVMPSSSPP